MRKSLLYISWSLLALFLTFRNVSAQETSFGADSVQIWFEQALSRKQAGDLESAESILRKLIQRRPVFADSANRSAWFVLGQVLLARERAQAAFQTWLQGRDVLRQAEAPDIRLDAALLNFIISSRSTDFYETATGVFYELLRVAPNRGFGKDLLQRIFAQSQFFLPDDLQRQFLVQLNDGSQITYPGRWLLQFWRAKDLTPATLLNERLLEHLQRVYEAGIRFAAGNLRGFDDRGEIYVRLGEPTATTSAGTIGLDSSKNPPKVYYFLPHEVWSYGFLDRMVFFPFVDFKDGKGYRLVDRIEKAIPRDSYVRGGTKSQRGPVSRLDIRSYFYDQLAKNNPVFYNWVKEIEDLRGDEDLVGTTFVNSRLSAVARSMKALYTTTTLDIDAESRRVDMTPDIASEVLADVQDLPFDIQTARFLEPDGATRVELYLGVLKKDLMSEKLQPLLPIDTLSVRLRAGLENNAYWLVRQFSDTLTSLTGSDYPSVTDTLLTQFSLRTDLQQFFVGGQIESWLTGIGLREPDEKPFSFRTGRWGAQDDASTLLKMSSFRTGRLQKLQAGRQSLLLSDVQLSKKIIPEAAQASPNKDGLYVEPYPFKRVARNKPLFLYFEIYGLQPSPQGETRYRVAYEAEQVSTKRSVLGKIRSLFGSGRQGRVELNSELTSDVSNPKEWIALDLHALDKGQIRLRVQVTDLQSKSKAERSVEFELF